MPRRRLALAGSVASSAAYVTGKLAALVGQASYATALAIARSLPGHKKKKKNGQLVTPEVGNIVWSGILHPVESSFLGCYAGVSTDDLTA